MSTDLFWQLQGTLLVLGIVLLTLLGVVLAIAWKLRDDPVPPLRPSETQEDDDAAVGMATTQPSHQGAADSAPAVRPLYWPQPKWQNTVPTRPAELDEAPAAHPMRRHDDAKRGGAP